MRRRNRGSGSAEDERAGIMSWTGTRRSSRTLNSDFVDIQPLHHIANESTQRDGADRVPSDALNMTGSEDCRPLVQFHLSEDLDDLATATETGIDNIASGKFESNQVPTHGGRLAFIYVIRV